MAIALPDALKELQPVGDVEREGEEVGEDEEEEEEEAAEK